MELRLRLSNINEWKLKISEDYTDIQNDNISLDIDLIEISQIREPYIILPDENEVQKVISSIKNNDYLHPIFVFRKNNKFVLADGTHRIQALKQLNCELIPAIIIDEEQTWNDAWVKILKSKAPHYKTIYKKISPLQRKNLIHKEFDLISIDSLMEFQYKKDIIAVYKDGKHVHVFSSKDPKSNRFEHLKLMKYFDDIIDDENKEYTLISKIEEEQFNFNKYLMIPPPDNFSDLDYLVKYKELRRPKAFRIKTPIRLIHLPIPIDMLRKVREEAINEFNTIIENSMENFTTIFLKLSFSKKFEISWYYHILLIGSKISFLNEIDNEKEKILVNQLLDKVKLEESESLEVIT